MKLFLKEHLLLIVVQILQFSLIVLVFWLAGFRDGLLATYGMFLGILILICYLLYRYISHRFYYRRLSKPLTTIDETFEIKGKTPMDIALAKLLKSSNALYQHEMDDRIRKQEEHLIFMDLWVHQMKTPLSVIELMASDLDEPHSSNIRDENEKLKNGLHTVLYMARLRAINQDFHVKKLDVVNIVQQVNKENKRLYIRNRVYPKLENRDEQLQVESDEKWLYFMITQLVHNAVKYSTGKSDQVIFRFYKRNKQTALSIQDFGVGIPTTDVRRIFDAFYTGENGRIFKESTGVGLYVTKEVATYLGHTIEVESTVGEGTTFTILF